MVRFNYGSELIRTVNLNLKFSVIISTGISSNFPQFFHSENLKFCLKIYDSNKGAAADNIFITIYTHKSLQHNIKKFSFPHKLYIRR